MDTHIQLMLLSVKNLSNADTDSDAIRERVMAILAGVLNESLRKNDIMTRFSPGSFLVILVGVDNEARQTVINRIIENFDFRINNNNILLKYDIVDMKTDEGD